MNKRLDELVDRLADDAMVPVIGRTGLHTRSFSLERYTELIVAECVRYVNEDYQRDFDALWREDLTKGIKEHFGVEE